ncbi:ABC transporter domain-containing protein [Ditylenchus destructor]|uniref:ABC transporter domain-containing protein n=1 Tax=Ditylenchus destructor TaxID=166010 RepID=A0AAD4MEM6_9BILA|nr:ABC transporter domain-containing protein [Ditylenchus destructor]
MEAAQGVSSGKKVIDIKDISFAFGDRTMVPISPPPSCVATASPDRPQRQWQDNAAEAAAGRTAAAAGAARRLERDRERGRRPRFPRVQRQAQARARLPAGLHVHPRTRARADHPLSGGERNRLLLAKLFAQPSNLLVMDEPTNDLDVETLELLEELLGRIQRHVAAGQP